MPNRVSVTLACFLAYCVMAGMLSPIGVIVPPLAETLGVPRPEAAALFSWLTFGILGGSALALVIFDLLSLRAVMLVVYAAITTSILALRLGDHPWLLRLALGTVGVGCGIGLAGAASGISLLFTANRRAAMLVITDGAFSAAGAATAALAAMLVPAGFHWASSYLLLAVLAALIVLIAGVVRFPASEAARVAELPAGEAPARTGSWPLPVWLCIAGLFLYTLGQNAMLWWLPTHLETALGVDPGTAGEVVSRYWIGMFCGQLVVAGSVLRFGARRMVLASALGTLAGSLPLWLVAVPGWLPWLTLGWGFLNFGLLKMVIAFASLTVPVPPPRLIAALLFGATLGTAVSPLVTSAIVEALSPLRVLQFSSFCYLLLAALVAAARRWPAPGLAQPTREEPAAGAIP